jgi:hypothetical protein
VNNGLLRNVHVVDGFVAAGHHSGLLVGTSNGVVSDCSSSGQIEASEYVGGLAGQSLGTVTRSSSSATVKGTGQAVGGLVGSAQDTLSESFATGGVEGTFAVGGLAGMFLSGIVQDCYSRCGVVQAAPEPPGSAYASGGLLGLVGAVGDVTVQNSYASCQVFIVGPADTIEGLIGESVTVLDVTASFFDTAKTGTGTYGTPATPAEMMDQSTFTGWDFSDTWKFDPGISTFPTLQWQ